MFGRSICSHVLLPHTVKIGKDTFCKVKETQNKALAILDLGPKGVISVKSVKSTLFNRSIDQ